MSMKLIVVDLVVGVMDSKHLIAFHLADLVFQFISNFMDVHEKKRNS